MIIDKTWTLFLDRDGVINKKIDGDYVRNFDQFKFIYGSLSSIRYFSKLFGRIIIVTNQRGVSKGLMSIKDLALIHSNMFKSIKKHKGRIDNVYFCTDLSDESYFRKPNVGMALQSKLDYTDICFEKSIIVGDSLSDIDFGNRLNMKTVFITKNKIYDNHINFIGFFSSLNNFKNYLKSFNN